MEWKLGLPDSSYSVLNSQEDYFEYIIKKQILADSPCSKYHDHTSSK